MSKRVPGQRAQLKTAAAAKEFTLAGNATLTLVSAATGNEIKFKVRRWDRGGHIVRLVSGGNPEYVGLIDMNGFRPTAASGFTSDSSAVRAFRYYWKGIQAGELPPMLTVYHEGSCCACGRALRTPDSVASGWGPDCLKERMILRCA